MVEALEDERTKVKVSGIKVTVYLILFHPFDFELVPDEFTLQMTI